MYVVKNEGMTHKAIIELNVLRQGEKIIIENGIVFKSKKMSKVIRNKSNYCPKY